MSTFMASQYPWWALLVLGVVLIVRRERVVARRHDEACEHLPRPNNVFELHPAHTPAVVSRDRRQEFRDDTINALTTRRGASWEGPASGQGPDLGSAA